MTLTATKTMKKTLILVTLLLSGAAFAQDPDPASPVEAISLSTSNGEVTIASKGLDVRNVLFDLFSQSKKSFVLEPNVRFVLYLALSGVQFDEALDIVCNTAGLSYEINNGIYFVGKSKAGATVKGQEPNVSAPKAPLGRITDAELQKKLTTRLSKTDIRDVFAEFGKQTGLTIEVDKAVPGYKVDAFLVTTSLRYALDVVTKAAGLTYNRTDNRTIRISVKA